MQWDIMLALVWHIDLTILINSRKALEDCLTAVRRAELVEKMLRGSDMLAGSHEVCSGNIEAIEPELI